MEKQTKGVAPRKMALTLGVGIALVALAAMSPSFASLRFAERQNQSTTIVEQNTTNAQPNNTLLKNPI
jgi:hypothetical protein